MKKLFVLLLLCSIVVVGCKKHRKESITTLNVEQIVSKDNKYLVDNYGDAYSWYETQILFDNYLDSDSAINIVSISNVFQVIKSVDNGMDTQVLTWTHELNQPDKLDIKEGFWVEDFPLTYELINVKFKQAFDRMMAANYVKPHSKHCVLRKPIGPNVCNSQYIFGNTKSQIYVDAVTGEVSDINPAFKEN